MEITSWDIYWITRLDAARCFLTVFYVLCSVSCGIASVVYFVSIVEDEPSVIPVTKKCLIISTISFFVGLFLWTLTPTTKQAAAMIVLPKIINNQQLQQIPDKVMQLGLEWIEELKPNKTKETK